MEYITGKQKHCLCLGSCRGGKNHMQAPSIDFRCSLTVLAALRAVILFVPLPLHSCSYCCQRAPEEEQESCRGQICVSLVLADLIACQNALFLFCFQLSLWFSLHFQLHDGRPRLLMVNGPWSLPLWYTRRFNVVFHLGGNVCIIQHSSRRLSHVQQLQYQVHSETGGFISASYCWISVKAADDAVYVSVGLLYVVFVAFK